MLYAWITILAVIGCSQVWLNFSNRFTQYMKKQSFLIYIFHYLPMNFIAYTIIKYWNLPIILNYLLVLIFSIVVTLATCEIVSRIPVLKFLFGMKQQNRATAK